MFLYFTSIIDGSSSCYRLVTRPIIHQKSTADLVAKYSLRRQCQKKTANPYTTTVLALWDSYVRLSIAYFQFLQKCYTNIARSVALLIKGGEIRQGDIKNRREVNDTSHCKPIFLSRLVCLLSRLMRILIKMASHAESRSS